MLMMPTLKSESKIKSDLSNYQQYPRRVRRHCQSNFRCIKKKYYNKRRHYINSLDIVRLDFVQHAIFA